MYANYKIEPGHAFPARGAEIPTDAPVGPMGLGPATGANANVTAATLVSEDERALLFHVLRILDRALAPGPLPPIEQAFIAGAKVMFEQLAKSCEDILARRRREEAVAAHPADMAESPSSAGPGEPSAAPAEARPAKRTTKRR